MRKVMMGIVVLVVGVVVCGQAPQALPGRMPMHAHLLKPSAEWNAYYDVATEDQRCLYWTTKALLTAVKDQAKTIQELDRRIIALETAEQAAVEPNSAAQ